MVSSSNRERSGALHLLSARQVVAARDGDHNDGGGLRLRVRENAASWVFRFTATSGKRRELGLGVAHRGSLALAGESLMLARREGHAARGKLAAGRDPIDDRRERRESAREAEVTQKATKAREQLTLARAARKYHEEAVEPRLSAKHASRWIASLENHVPPDIWHAPIDQIDAPSLLEALAGVRSLEDPERRVPETLQRVRQRLDAIFEDAIFHKHCAAKVGFTRDRAHTTGPQAGGHDGQLCGSVIWLQRAGSAASQSNISRSSSSPSPAGQRSPSMRRCKVH